MANLPTDFKDDILASSNTRRKYNMIRNDDKTFSFEDVTDYSQVGSTFGADELNATNEAVNASSEEIQNITYAIDVNSKNVTKNRESVLSLYSSMKNYIIIKEYSIALTTRVYGEYIRVDGNITIGAEENYVPIFCTWSEIDNAESPSVITICEKTNDETLHVEIMYPIEYDLIVLTKVTVKVMFVYNGTQT